MLLQVCSGLFVGPVVRLAAPRAHKDALQRRALVRGQPHLEVQPRWGLEEPRRHRLHLQILVRRLLAPKPERVHVDPFPWFESWPKSVIFLPRCTSRANLAPRGPAAAEEHVDDVLEVHDGAALLPRPGVQLALLRVEQHLWFLR